MVRNDQINLINNFQDRVQSALKLYGVNSNHVTEQRLTTVLQDFQDQFILRLREFERRLNNANGNANDDNNFIFTERSHANTVYNLHHHHGKWRRVPSNWRVPRCGIYDLWRQWWIGDSVHHIHPLRFLKLADVDFLDSIPLDESSEMHGRKGKHKQQRRPISKIMYDMRKTIQQIVDLLKERGAYEEDINEKTTIGAIDRMFARVSDVYNVKDRDVQKNWTTYLRSRRKRKANKIDNESEVEVEP
jgi:hypothetical protein